MIYQNIRNCFELGEKKSDLISFDSAKMLWQYPSFSALTFKTYEYNKIDKILGALPESSFNKHSIIIETFRKV